MQEKLICCCGASGWTRVIGWFQVIGHSIYTTVFLIQLLISISATGPKNTGSGNGAYTDWSSSIVKSGGGNEGLGLGRTSPGGEWDFTAAMTGLIPVVSAILFFLGFAMSIVLLRGSYTKNKRYLQAWLIYNGIFFILWTLAILVVSIVVAYAVEGGTAYSIAILIFGLINCLTQGFCLWVVYTHKNEINGATGIVYSTLSEVKF